MINLLKALKKVLTQCYTEYLNEDDEGFSQTVETL